MTVQNVSSQTLESTAAEPSQSTHNPPQKEKTVPTKKDSSKLPFYALVNANGSRITLTPHLYPFLTVQNAETVDSLDGGIGLSPLAMIAAALVIAFVIVIAFVVIRRRQTARHAERPVSDGKPHKRVIGSICYQ